MSEYCKNCYELAEQLKRKEQECKELKEKLERQKGYTVTYKSYIYEEKKQLKKQLQSKEQKLEKIKILAKKDKELAKRYGEVDTLARVVLQIIEGEENKKLKQECEELKQWKEDAENLFKTQTDNADKIINRYKQALDEIEEIVNTTLALLNLNKTENKTELKTAVELESRFKIVPMETIKQIYYIINKAKEGK